MGITAVQTLDASRFSIEVVAVEDKDTAAKKLRVGEISAYIVVPEGFTRAINRGKILPLDYYTTESFMDVSAIMKNEITEVISTYLKESQRGVFAAERLLNENGYEKISNREMNNLAIGYADLILDRSKLYVTEITGYSFGLSLVDYIAIGLSVTFICVFAIPFACLFSRKDNAFIKTLRAKGTGAFKQVFAEYSAMLSVYVSVLATIFICLAAFGSELPGILSGVSVITSALRVCAVAATVCSLAFLVFEISGNIITAVTGYFFISFALCYISGCVYPITALPDTLQKAADFLPTGAARVYLSKGVSGEDTLPYFAVLSAFTALFLCLSVLARRRKLGREEG